MQKLLSVVTILFVLAMSTAAQTEKITIVGSGSGASLRGSMLKALTDAFRRSHPEVALEVSRNIDSGKAIETVGTDQEVIGRITRPLNEQEKSYGLTYVPILKTPIVFVVNKRVGVTELSAQQICDIYRGKITNWQEVGGKDARIRVLRREAGAESMQAAVNSLPGFKDITITSKATTIYSDPRAIAYVEKYANTIAIGTYPNAKDARVAILNVDGKSVHDVDYPLTSTLALIFKEQNNTGNVKKFVSFVTSMAADEAIRVAGGIPVSESMEVVGRAADIGFP